MLTKKFRKESNESPLLYFTRNQMNKLKEKIGNEKIIVDFAMRYGNPSIKSKLNYLRENGCENIVILPLVSAICSRNYSNSLR